MRRIGPFGRRLRRRARPSELNYFNTYALIAALVVPGAVVTSGLTVPSHIRMASSHSSQIGLLVTPSKFGRLAAANSIYPTGTSNANEPSGESPPSATAFPGYTQTYVTDFNASTLPDGWSSFIGTPVGDPGGQWGAAHVTLNGGVLQLTTFQDPQYNNQWVAGGVCQCGLERTYGAYFVRSKMTGGGPTQVEMLWPASGWPPEIDFSETYGATTYSMATDHFTPANLQIQRTVRVDMTQWHTWGVIWTPTAITYTVDGTVWGRVVGPLTIPNQSMTLHIQQQTWCASGFACPASPQSTLVDWVAEYATTTHQSAIVGPFANRSSGLSASLRRQIAAVAQRVEIVGGTSVTITGYGDTTLTQSNNSSIGRSRAAAVARYLRSRLALLNARGINIQVDNSLTSHDSKTGGFSWSPPTAHRVLVSIS